ncbi:MAG: zinc metalloprotease HtpX [Pseudomonadota bacterium]|nr:zinc metalloprotease HtpX [Pseudomonadota bacterium]
MNRVDHFAPRRHALLNLVQTWLLVGGSLVLLVACAHVFFGPGGIVYALVFGGVSLFMASRISPQLVLRMYRAVPVGRDRFAAGHAILDELASRAGLSRRPRLYVLPSEMMNAFAVGRRTDSAICMTDRLIRSLTGRELAGVMAHEITHISNEDVRVMAIADMVSRFTSVMSTLGVLTLFVNLPAMLAGGTATIPWLGIALLMAAPTIGALLQMALSRTREYDADLGAVMLTGDPDGLASALTKLEQAQRRHWEGMVLPGGRMPDPSLLRSHPHTAERIARLMALKRREATDQPETAPARRHRESPVPKIRPRWGRGEASRYSDYASLLDARTIAPVPGGRTHDTAASRETLAPPRGRPRIRIRSGGVYW